MPSDQFPTVARPAFGQGRIAELAPILALLVCWLVCISWRPALLGFYHDDWSLLTVTSPYGAPLISGGQSRILNVALGYLAVSLFGTNSVLWHVYGAILVLITSGFFYLGSLAVARALAAGRVASRWAAALGAMVWMLTPTSLGYAAWPVMFPGLWAVALIMLAIYLVTSDCESISRLLQAAICVVLSTLIYEAFWFCFLPMAMLVVAADPEKRWQNGLRALLVLGTAQSAVIGWSLYLAANGAGTGKQLNSRLWDIVNAAPRWVGELLATSLVVGQLIVLLGVIFLAVLFWRAKPYRGPIIALAATAFGAATTITLFYAAGYGMTPKGVFSRTYIAFNVWLGLSVTIAGVVLSGMLHGQKRRLFWLLALVAIAWLGSRNVVQTLRWAEAWTFQQQLLAELPEQRPTLDALPTALILILPNRAERVESLSASWDATAAIYVMREDWRDAIASEDIWVTVSREGEFLTTWDGSKVTQSWCRAPSLPLWSVNAASAITFDARNGMGQLAAGTEIGCDELAN